MGLVSWLLAACGLSVGAGRPGESNAAGSGGAGGAHGGGGGAGGGAGAGWGAPLDCQALSGTPRSSSYELVFEERSKRISYVVAKDELTLVGYLGGEVVSIGPGGTLSTLPLEPVAEALGGDWTPSLLSPRGNAFIARGAGDTRGTAILDFASGAVATFEPPADLDLLDLAFSDSGMLVIALIGTLVPERSYPELVEVRRLNGEVIASQPPRERTPFIPATDDLLVWLEETALSGVDFGGREVFRYPVPGHLDNTSRSADGRTFLMESGRSVTLVTPGSQVVHPPVDLGDAPRQRALSPTGAFAVAGTTGEQPIQKLRSGVLEGALETGISDYGSLDVNDDGFVIVAGLAADKRQLVELLSWDGRLILSCSGAPDETLWPYAGFTPGGRYAYAHFPDRLLFFEVPGR